ncbi:MAG: repeat-containing protein [Cyanobacteria bacterium RYN_339]|nr:repeat-containing protein [Cyanobacteria bacterium RYN_339]
MHRLIAPIAASLLLAACAGVDVTTTDLKSVSTDTLAARANAKLKEANGPALLAGAARGPEGVVGANIVASNSSRLIGNNGGSIVASNSSRFGVLALAEKPITNAIVYVTDADERFYATNGKPFTTTTDTAGKYSFASGLPTNEVVIVNVILADNKREVGYTVSKAGKNTVDVSLATNYVTEFLRDRAQRQGKAMSAYDLTALVTLTRLTQQALDTGDLAVPTLGIGDIAAMNQTYALAVGLNKQNLGEAWAKLLGERVLALTTVIGSGDGGFSGNGGPATAATLYKPKGIARDAVGNLYVCEEGNDAIRKVTADGKLDGFMGNGQTQFAGDGGPAVKAGLNWPRTLLIGPGDVMYVADTLNMRIRRVQLPDGNVSTIAGNPVQAAGAWLNDFAGDGGPAAEARLAGVRGMALDHQGRLVFADTWDNDGGVWHHIRRIDKDGTMTTLVGVDGKHGYNGDNKKGRETWIDYTQQLAVDEQDNIYFADNRNHRVRKYDAQTELVTTLAGDGTDGTKGDNGPATSAQLSSPYGVAVDKGGRVFISERGSKRIRVVLKDGTIHTLAGGGTFDGDGEARAVSLVEPHDILIEPNGNLLLCDSRAARVRRLWLKWGF